MLIFKMKRKFWNTFISEEFLLLFIRKLNSWIIRVNFTDFFLFLIITVLTFPRYFLRKLNMVLQSLLLDTGSSSSFLSSQKRPNRLRS